MTRFSVPTWLVFIAVLGAAAGEVGAQQLPAVSGVNGKLEFDAGALSLPTPAFVTRAAGTLTIPVGARFGLQIDGNFGVLPSFSSGAAVHLFTRDPASYLIGGALGVIQMPGAIVAAAGPEAELYFDRWTVEAWAGVSYTHPAAPSADRLRPFAMGTLAYYPDDNWRVSLGLSSLDGYTAFHVGTEYQFMAAPYPLSVVGNARVGQDGALLATLGLKAYLGAPDKPLIRRHREDDPADLGTLLYHSADGRVVPKTSSSEPPPGTSSSSAPPSELPSEPPSSQPPSSEPPTSSSEQPGDDDHPGSSSSSSSASSSSSSSSHPPTPDDQCKADVGPAYEWNGFECVWAD